MRYAPLFLLAFGITGCHEDPVSVRDVTPPAAPRGVFSTTGDQSIVLRWLPNTDYDVAGYIVYRSTCSSGPGCPYDRVASTSGTSFVVGNLPNGVTYYYAVSAFDAAGNESDLSYDDVFDTPRPAGSGLVLANYLTTPDVAGYDFSAYTVTPFDAPNVDIYFGNANGLSQMVAPYTDTDIQDAGFANTLDAVDFAPDGGWSPTGTAELILGHCYIVWTHENHFAKFRVTRLTGAAVEVEWAYQVAEGNPELSVRRAIEGPRRLRPGMRSGS